MRAMHFNKPRFASTALLALLLSVFTLVKAQAPILVQTNATIMIQAVQNGIYGSFVSAGSPEFKDRYTQEAFKVVSEAFSPRLAQGYEVSYLTNLKLHGYEVYLWKLSYNDGGDDSLVSLSIQNGYIVGFLIQ